MKKYVQTQGGRPFDWNKALAKDCKDMTEDEITNMDNLALSWVTCACGNQCDIIPRESGKPVDDKLRRLGGEFHDLGINQMAWSMNNYFNSSYSSKQSYLKEANTYRQKALKILAQIEKRSAILIDKEVRKIAKSVEELGFKLVKK